MQAAFEISPLFPTHGSSVMKLRVDGFLLDEVVAQILERCAKSYNHWSPPDWHSVVLSRITPR